MQRYDKEVTRMNELLNDIDVSVIIPFYKGNKYINNTLDSIFTATRNVPFDFQYEIIIVNDSPQTTVDLHDSHNPHIHIIKNEKNMGIHATRNVGLNIAKGEYILFLDQDDNIAPTFFTDMIKRGVEDPSADVIVANAICEQKNYEVNLYRNKFSFPIINRLFFYINDGPQIISPGQTIIKRSIIPELWRKIYLSNNGADDYLLWIIILLKKCRFSYIHKPLYRHCYTDENLSNNVDKMKISEKEVAKVLLENNYIDRKFFNYLLCRGEIQKILKAHNVSTINFWKALSHGVYVIIAYIIVKIFRFR